MVPLTWHECKRRAHPRAGILYNVAHLRNALFTKVLGYPACDSRYDRDRHSALLHHLKRFGHDRITLHCFCATVLCGIGKMASEQEWLLVDFLRGFLSAIGYDEDMDRDPSSNLFGRYLLGKSRSL